MYGHPNGTAGRPSPPIRGQSAGPQIAEEGPDYEHQQQAEMDKQNEQEQAPWREQSDQTPVVATQHEELPNPHDPESATQLGQDRDHPIIGGVALGAALSPPWQPLNVKRGGGTPEPHSLHNAPVPPTTSEPAHAIPPAADYTQSDYHSEAHSDLIPPPSMAQLHNRAPTPGTEGFRTPAESPNLELGSFQHSAPTIPDFGGMSTVPEATSASPLPIPVPTFARAESYGPARPASPSIVSPTSGGKMSAGAFRKAAPRRSETTGTTAGEEEGTGSDVSRGARRLPAPPGGYTSGVAGPSGAPAGAPAGTGVWTDEKRALAQKEAFEDAAGDERGAPPSYGAAPSHDESLR